MMRILVTGASGYVGARILRDLSELHEISGTFLNHKLMSGLDKLDVRDKKAVLHLVLAREPDLVIHTAAISSRESCERNPARAELINVQGTRNVVDAANEVGAVVFYISSFGASNPITKYGRTKLDSEKCVKEARKGYNILRLSMTFGCSPNTQNDRPFNRILSTLERGEPTSYDNTWEFSPTYLGHVSSTINALLDKRIKNKTIDIAVPELKSMYQVASDILRPFGKSVKPKNSKKSKNKKEALPRPNNLGLPTCSYDKMISDVTAEVSKLLLTGDTGQRLR